MGGPAPTGVDTAARPLDTYVACDEMQNAGLDEQLEPWHGERSLESGDYAE